MCQVTCKVAYVARTKKMPSLYLVHHPVKSHFLPGLSADCKLWQRGSWNCTLPFLGPRKYFLLDQNDSLHSPRPTRTMKSWNKCTAQQPNNSAFYIKKDKISYFNKDKRLCDCHYTTFKSGSLPYDDDDDDDVISHFQPVGCQTDIGWLNIAMKNEENGPQTPTWSK